MAFFNKVFARKNQVFAMTAVSYLAFSQNCFASMGYFHSANYIHNYKTLEEFAGMDIAPVLKADAYGVGLAEVVRDAITPIAPKRVTVTRLAEAEVLREGGFQGRIIMIGSNNLLDLNTASALKVELVVSDFELLREAVLFDIPTHVEFDSGMGRFGFELEEVQDIVQEYLDLGSAPMGVSTHLSSADSFEQVDCEFTSKQLDSFKVVAEVMKTAFPRVETHVANSAGVLLQKGCSFDFARVGLALYGQSPLVDQAAQKSETLQPALKPVLSWSTKIAQIKRKKQGAFVGYGRTYTCFQGEKIAVLDVGYSDGYPRALSQSGAQVWVNGKRCDVRGNVCMNNVMIDVTDVEGVKVGDEVFLIGPFQNDHPEDADSDAPITLLELAMKAKTISWEILCRLRIY